MNGRRTGSSTITCAWTITTPTARLASAGLAAAGGVSLNILYISSGSAGTNGLFIIVGAVIIAAWRIAGHFGLDYFLVRAPRAAES